MSHSQHDVDLIGALASGEPSPEAERLVASCPECARELREQTAVRQLLGSLPAVQLRAHEAQELERAVMSRLPGIVIAATPARPPVAPLWGRLSTVAAVLAGVVLVGALLTTQGGDLAATTTAQTQLALESEDNRVAAATTAAGDVGAGATAEAMFDSSLDSLRLRADELLADLASGESPATTSAALPEECAEIDGSAVLATAEATLNQRQVLIVVFEGETDPEARAFYLDDCSEIALP